MDVKNYTKQVEAVYFDGVTDVQEIAEWANGAVGQLVDPDGKMRTDMYVIDVPVGNGNYQTAGKDFYIVKESGYFFCIPAPEFNNMFTEISVG